MSPVCTSQVVDGPLTAVLRECWIDATNLRLSGYYPEWTGGSTIHAICVETVKVDEAHRRQGHLTRFLNTLRADPRFDMVVVEMVQNPVLAEALLRNGWECDPKVMDFYWRKW